MKLLDDFLFYALAGSFIVIALAVLSFSNARPW
jgi:hypothetical protein